METSPKSGEGWEPVPASIPEKEWKPLLSQGKAGNLFLLPFQRRNGNLS